MHKITLEYGMIDDRLIVKAPTTLVATPLTSIDTIEFAPLPDGKTLVKITLTSIIDGKIGIQSEELAK